MVYSKGIIRERERERERKREKESAVSNNVRKYKTIIKFKNYL